MSVERIEGKISLPCLLHVVGTISDDISGCFSCRPQSVLLVKRLRVISASRNRRCRVVLVRRPLDEGVKFVC